jgi:hypothetical protein
LISGPNFVLALKVSWTSPVTDLGPGVLNALGTFNNFFVHFSVSPNCLCNDHARFIFCNLRHSLYTISTCFDERLPASEQTPPRITNFFLLKPALWTNLSFTIEIFELEGREKNLRQYLYIVGLEIKRHLPPPTSEKSRQLSSFPCDLSASIKLFGDVEFVRTCVEKLLKSCTPKSHQGETPEKNKGDSITQCPSCMIERP